jgi:uracil-DNA glycosylase family 4
MLDEALLNTLELVRALKGGLEWLSENGESMIDLPKNHAFFQEVQNLQHQRQIASIQPPPHLPRIDVSDFPVVEQNPNVWTEQKTAISFELPPPNPNLLNQKAMQLMVKPIGLTAERLQAHLQAEKEYQQALEQAKNPKPIATQPSNQQFWAKSQQNNLGAYPQKSQVSAESLQKAQSKLDQFLTPQTKSIQSSQQPPQAPIQPQVPIQPQAIQFQQTQTDSLQNELKVLPPNARKFIQISEINEQIQKCQSCFRCNTRVVPIFGQGSLSPVCMFVDAFPKESGNLSGLLLSEPDILILFSRLLDAIGLNRHQIYLTSMLKCGPNTPDSLLQSGVEIQACSPYFWQEVSIVQPKLIIALGAMTHDMIYPEQNTFKKYMGQNLVLNNPINPSQTMNYTTIPHPLDLHLGGDETKKMVWSILRKIAQHYGLNLKTVSNKPKV